MAEFRVMEALTAPVPTERQWIIRAAAEMIVKGRIVPAINDPNRTGRAAAILAAGELATNAVFYLADLSASAWTRLGADIALCAEWAKAHRWEF